MAVAHGQHVTDCGVGDKRMGWAGAIFGKMVNDTVGQFQFSFVNH
jgi:hypothetical protein